jgi:PadR family transcriptional regulator PadR
MYILVKETPLRRLGDFECAVLVAVSFLNGGGYGVSIRGELEQRLSRSISLGAVYTTLDRLLAKGYVRTVTGEATPQRGGRAKKYFLVTDSGARAIESARRGAEALWSMPVAMTSGVNR